VLNSNKIKVKIFQATIIEWFNVNHRNFDWRIPGLPAYELIISEILLQRTRAETVAKFYKNFLADYPDWQAIANSELQVLEQTLKPLGLYRQRAAKLTTLANFLIASPILPLERSQLDRLPFMGQYIANAVQLLLQDQRKPLLDVNMARVLERYFGPRRLADIRYDPYLQKLAHEVVDHKQYKKINWAILDFSALVCKRTKPLCVSCPLNAECIYYNNANKNN
jgi:A/G-specific adenine glycosylase